MKKQHVIPLITQQGNEKPKVAFFTDTGKRVDNDLVVRRIKGRRVEFLLDPARKNGEKEKK